MKKRLCVIFILAVVCIFSTTVSATDPFPGDTNLDKKLNSADAIYLLRHILLPEQYPMTQSADMNGDGQLNSSDAIYLLRHSLAPKIYPLKNGVTCPHQEILDPAVAPTCTSTGLTEGSHCSFCLETIVEQEIVQKTEHQYVDNLCSCGMYRESMDLEFTIQGEICVVTGIGTCTDARIVVPETYQGYPVMIIGKKAFMDVCGFYEIILPQSIRAIEAFAFRDCKDLKTIVIPPEVKGLERETFSGCTSLETVVLPPNLLQIMENCFYGCRSLKNIELPSTLLKIREYAFAECESLETITLPSSLNEIQQFAFFKCYSLYLSYAGPQWKYKRLHKGFEWCEFIASSEIQCADGPLDIYWYLGGR